MYANLHRVPTQKTFLPTQREDIKYIDKSKWQPGHKKSNSGWWGHCCCSWEPLVLAGSAVGVGAGRSWGLPESFVCCFLRSQGSAGLRHWTVLCRAFVLPLLAPSLTELSRVQAGTQSKLLHFCFTSSRCWSLYRPSVIGELHPKLISSVLCSEPEASCSWGSRFSEAPYVQSFRYFCGSSYHRIQILHKHLCTNICAQLHNIIVSLANGTGFFMERRHKGAQHRIFAAKNMYVMSQKYQLQRYWSIVGVVNPL